jgi:hypothetical protein
MAEKPHKTVTRSFCFIPLLMAFDDPVRPQDQKKSCFVPSAWFGGRDTKVCNWGIRIQ